MWRFQSKRNSLRDQLLLAAPEANPHEFIRRYLHARPLSSKLMSSEHATETESSKSQSEKPHFSQPAFSRQPPHPIPAQ
jgi:hypothetical protein